MFKYYKNIYLIMSESKDFDECDDECQYELKDYFIIQCRKCLKFIYGLKRSKSKTCPFCGFKMNIRNVASSHCIKGAKNACKVCHKLNDTGSLIQKPLTASDVIHSLKPSKKME